MSDSLTTIPLLDLLVVAGGRNEQTDGNTTPVPQSKPPVSGEHCKDGMDFGVQGGFKVKTPVVQVEGNGTFVKCK